jgi:hypothetical protein
VYVPGEFTHERAVAEVRVFGGVISFVTLSQSVLSAAHSSKSAQIGLTEVLVALYPHKQVHFWAKMGIPRTTDFWYSLHVDWALQVLDAHGRMYVQFAPIPSPENPVLQEHLAVCNTSGSFKDAEQVAFPLHGFNPTLHGGS